MNLSPRLFRHSGTSVSPQCQPGKTSAAGCKHRIGDTLTAGLNEGLIRLNQQIGILDIMTSSEVADFVHQLLAQDDTSVLEFAFDGPDHVAA